MLPALQITVYPAGRDQFRATVGGRVVAVSDEPFQAAAQVLLSENVDPATPIVCRRIGRAEERSTVGAMAGPEVTRRLKPPRLKPPPSESSGGSGSGG